MVERRNLADEILAIRARQQTDFVEGEITLRLIEIEHAFENRDRKNKELLRYFPIAIVACIESFFRLSIKNLVEAGEPYISNAEELLLRNQVPFGVIKALHGQSIKVGDIIGHSVPLSSLTHIDSHMSKLMRNKFLEEISRVHDRWKVEVLNLPKVPIVSSPETTFRNVAKTFELRHILCHETANNFGFNQEDIEGYFEHSVLFLQAARQFISETLHPNAPLTQADMNIQSYQDYEKEKARLDDLTVKVADCLNDKQKKELKIAVDAWREFLKASVELEGLKYEGGSIRPTIENGAAAQLTRDRIVQMERLLKATETI